LLKGGYKPPINFLLFYPKGGGLLGFIFIGGLSTGGGTYTGYFDFY